MAWRWVNALELLDGTYFYFSDPSISYRDVASYFERIGGTSVTEAALGIAEAARTLAYIDERSNINTAPFGTFRYLLKNGIIIETSKTGSTSSCQWRIRFYDINNNLLASCGATTNLPYYPLLCGVLAVSDDEERAYFGKCAYNRNTSTGRAVVDYEIEQSESVNNLYTLLKDAFPSGGGGGSNPYEGGGYSEPTDETGDFDETSDIIEEPTLPASLAVASGFLTVYNPTYTQVVDLGNYVWNSLPVDTLKKMFSNPMDVIIGLSIFPFLIDDDSKNWEIMIGNINSHVTARKARNQFQVVDCGKLYIKPYSKSYLDYSPYTKIELALPYIGTKQLDTDIIMGKWIWVKYRVDLISGGCMAILSFSDTENGEYSVIAEYTGKCNIEIPISGSDFRELGRGILQAVR